MEIKTGYEKLDDRQLLMELGRKLGQITYARQVGNQFMVNTYKGHRNMILREADSRGLLQDFKMKEIELADLAAEAKRRKASCG